MRIEWSTSRSYKFGVDRGVIYPRSVPPVAWNGLVSVTEQATDGGQNVMYYDGQRYIQSTSPESFSASVEAITYPDELDADPEFDFSYRTMMDEGYELHLVYNAKLSSDQFDYSTNINDVSPILFKWTLSTVPERLDYALPSAHVIINSNEATAALLEEVEGLIYGTDGVVEPRFPRLPELIQMFEAGAVFKIIDNGDGTWTAIGPDDMIQMLDATSFKIISNSAYYIDSNSYKISSW